MNITRRYITPPRITRRSWLAHALVLYAVPALPQAAAPGVDMPAMAIPDAFDKQVQGEVLQWGARSAQAITAYLGRFPAPQAVVTLVPGGGAGVRSGLTFDGPPVGIRVTVGRDTTRQQFLADWVLVHEMVHLAIPQLPRRHNWFHEGAATYVEIIARARARLTTRESAWEQLVRSLHHGLPQPGEGGLDGTRRWGRTYWGGALFCLLADLEMRRQTSNRLGFQDAMAGLVRAGSQYGEHWSLERTLQTADGAVGVPVLMPLYDRMKDSAVPTDLPQLFSDLGLRMAGGVLRLVDAPDAAARRAILPERGQV